MLPRLTRVGRGMDCSQVLLIFFMGLAESAGEAVASGCALYESVGTVVRLCVHTRLCIRACESGRVCCLMRMGAQRRGWGQLLGLLLLLWATGGLLVGLALQLELTEWHSADPAAVAKALPRAAGLPLRPVSGAGLGLGCGARMWASG